MTHPSDDVLRAVAMTVPIDAQVECVRREIAMRRRVYPRWVRQERMTQKKADNELEAMEAVLATLQSIAERQLLL